MNKTDTATEIRSRIVSIVATGKPMGMTGIVRCYSRDHGAEPGILGAIASLIREGLLEERGDFRTGTARLVLAAHAIAPGVAAIQ